MANSPRPLPPLDLLVGFESAARHLSFTRAAAELFLTQSAVSRQVLALEAFYGRALFERRHRSLALTETGLQLYRTVAPVLEQLREATRKLRGAKEGRRLTVTTTISFASMWLVPRLARFRREHPGLDVRVAASSDVTDLERESIDLAIRDLPLGAAPPGAIVLMSDQVAPVCSPGYLKESRAAGRPLKQPADLARHVLLHMHDPHARYPFISWPTWLETNGLADLASEGTLVFGQHDQVIHAAMHGQGVALGRLSLLKQDLRDKRLVSLFGRAREIKRGFHVIYAKGNAPRPEAREFVAWIQQEIRREP